MLILARQIGERIKIGDEVTITVLDVQQHHYGHQVQLGIDAPKDIPVHREEIYDRIQQQKEQEHEFDHERSGNC